MVKRDNHKRQKATFRATILSMILNVLLALSKIICGIVSGAISVLADGFNNLSDSGSNIITIIGIKASDMPADKEHPYGHARSEYIAAMAVSFLILFLAFELLIESVDKIIEGVSSEFSVISVIAISIGIAIKLFMFFFNRAIGIKYSSELLIATSVDSLSDVFASGVVLASILIERFTPFSPDGYVGCLVVIFIAASGIKVLKRTVSELIGESPDSEIIDEIKNRLLSYEGIYGVHNLSVHNYVNKYYASVHVEIDADLPILLAHELIDKIEKDFDNDTDVKLTIHLDPVILHDRETTILLQKTEDIVKKIDPSYIIHDFRIIKCTSITKVIFDVYVPYEDKRNDNDICKVISDELYEEFGVQYEYFITVDRGA